MVANLVTADKDLEDDGAAWFENVALAERNAVNGRIRQIVVEMANGRRRCQYEKNEIGRHKR